MTRMVEALRNKKGRAAGYSGCGRCDGTWDWKEPHSTHFREGEGCFPLCEQCWMALTPEARLPYYRTLWAQWIGDAAKRGDDDIQKTQAKWPLIEKAVLAGE